MSSLSPSKSPATASHVSPHLSLELEHAVGFSGDLRNCIYPHPDGRSMVYPAGGCVVIADNTDPHNQVFLRGHDDRISCLHLSPDGSYIVSGQFGKNADACVWSFEERKLMFRVQSHDAGIACAAFSHDSKLLLTAGVVTDKRLFIWDVSTGKMNAQANLVPEVCTCCAWGGHERDIKKRLTRNYVFATAGARCIMLWTLDPYVGTLVGTKCNAGSHLRDYTCMAFGLGGEYLFCGSNSGDVTVFNVRNKVMQSTYSTSQGGVTSLLIAPASPTGDLSYLLVGGGDGVVNFMRGSGNSFVDVKQGSVQLSGMITSFGLSADARSAVVGTSQSIIYNVDIDSRSTQLLSESHSNSISAVCFPNDACETFSTVSSDLSVRVWNLTNYTTSAKATVRGAGNPLCCDFGLECVITGWADGKIRCFDSETGDILWLINDAHRDGVTALKVSHNLRFVVSGGALGDVRLWDIKSKELVCHLKEHTLAVTGIVLSLDDSHALSCSKDRAILTWDLRREKRVAAHMQVISAICSHSSTLSPSTTVLQRMGVISGVTIHPDSSGFFSVGQDRRISFWDLAHANPVLVTNNPHGDSEPTCICVSSCGRFLATGGSDQRVCIWDATNSALLAEGVGHSGTITSVTFSPDSKQMISVGADGCILVWNVFTA